jgi:hypothetical protein
MGRQATEDIPEVREGIDVEALAVAVEESRTAAVRQPRSRLLSSGEVVPRPSSRDAMLDTDRRARVGS